MHTLEQLQKRAIEIIDAQNYLAEPLSLYEPIDYGMRQGGKRIRPLLCLIAAELCGGEREKAEPAAVAVEMLHNFTLLHDDIMDCSPLRRGKPTVFRKYDQNKAILSGDAMFACAFKYLLQCDKEVIPQLTEILTRGAIEVCEGQGFDMDFENRQTVSTDEYLQMIKLKTGVLLSTALRLGAITAKADEKTLNLLDTFGKYIGIAFQIKDDMLDCWSDLDTFGKVCGADIIDRKKHSSTSQPWRVQPKPNGRSYSRSMRTPHSTKTKNTKSQSDIRTTLSGTKSTKSSRRIQFQSL